MMENTFESGNARRLDIRQVNILKHANESQFVDRKSKRIKPAKLSQTISALCNADGGALIIGIEDDHSWDGFTEPEEANGIEQLLHELFPLSQPLALHYFSGLKEKGLVVFIEVPKTSGVIKASDGKVYLRRGASNQPVTTQEQLKRLELNKGINSHEDATVKDEPKNIIESKIYDHFNSEIVPSAEKEPWLRKQRLIVEDKPTVACEILFSDEPQIALPKAAIKLYHYRTTDAEGVRENLAFQPITLEGCAYDLIKKAVRQTVEITEGIPIIGSDGFQQVKYPTEAIHEVVTNAVIHRDYSLNDDIHIRIFDNRIEVQSPGPLPAHITVKNILSERFARNPKIVRILNKFPDPPNKDVGEGLNTTFNAMRKLELREPTIVHRDTSVVVVLRHERLATLEDRLMEHLATGKHLNNALARELCNEPSDSKIRKAFRRMIDAKMIEKVPKTSGKGTKYRAIIKKEK